MNNTRNLVIGMASISVGIQICGGNHSDNKQKSVSTRNAEGIFNVCTVKPLRCQQLRTSAKVFTQGGIHMTEVSS